MAGGDTLKEFYTYLHCRPDGTPFYVGKGRGLRCRQFSKNRNPHYKNIVKKYGRKNVLVFVFPCLSEDEAFSDEMRQIAQLRCEGYDLCNITAGGEGASGFKWDDARREKIVRALTGKKRQSPSEETRKKLSIANSKPRTPRPESTRTKLSEALKKVTNTPEYKEKISAVRRGVKRKPRSPEHCARIAENKRKWWAERKAQNIA